MVEVIVEVRVMAKEELVKGVDVVVVEEVVMVMVVVVVVEEMVRWWLWR